MAPARQRAPAKGPPSTIVYSLARGSNVIDVDGNRYVDLAAGFGALLLGHGHPAIRRVLDLQSSRLLLALGDVHPADATIALSEKLSRLYPRKGARVLLGQSGADAVTAGLKTAALATGRPGVLAFRGAYHGLSHGPLAACGLRPSYRDPFDAQLNPHVEFIDYPEADQELEGALEAARAALAGGSIGAVLVEPILGRGGCIVPPMDFLPALGEAARAAGAVVIADEVWTGLGRSGHWLYSVEAGLVPDLVCLGKGLGGGLPMSACLGSEEVMNSWQREEEVVHTATFSGSPLACAAAIATLDTLHRDELLERSRVMGADWMHSLTRALTPVPSVVRVRGSGLMVGIELASGAGAAARAQRLLLERGFLVTSGGGTRQTIVLTPALTVAAEQLAALESPLVEVLRGI